MATLAQKGASMNEICISAFSKSDTGMYDWIQYEVVVHCSLDESIQQAIDDSTTNDWLVQVIYDGNCQNYLAGKLHSTGWNPTI